MRRRVLSLLFLTLLCLSAKAGEKASYSFEWGGFHDVFFHHSYTFINPLGTAYSADDSGFFKTWPGWYCAIAADFPIMGEWLKAGVGAAYSAAGKGTALFPLTARLRADLGSCGGGASPGKSRPFVLAECGPAPGERSKVGMVWVGRLAGGCSYSLGSVGKLDFILSARLTVDHPGIFDPVFGEVSAEEISFSRNITAAVCIGVALEF